MNVGELKKAVESGKVHPDGVVLAAFLGHSAAKELAPRKVPAAPANVTALVTAIGKLPLEHEESAHLATVRAVLAIARPILPLAKQKRAHDHATAFHATETWAQCPCDLCAQSCAELSRYGLSANEPRELQIQYHVAGVTLDRKYATKVIAACEKILGTKGGRERCIEELLGWALRTNNAVTASIGKRVFWWITPREGDDGVRTLDLADDLREQLAPIATGSAPTFKKPLELPVSTGQARNMVPNDLGLVVVSDKLKAKLGRIVEYAEVNLVRGKKSERAWIAYSTKPITALHGERYRSDQNPILDPNRVQDAPALFRLDDSHGDCWLVDSDYINDLIHEQGLQVGVRAHGAAFGCALGEQT